MTSTSAASPARMSSATAHTMKAIAFVAKERAELVDWELNPAPLAELEIAGRTLATLASPGTELNGYIAERGSPGLSGYAAVFEIEEIGTGVRDLKPGDRVFSMGNHVSRQRCHRAEAIRIPDGMDPAVAVFCRLMAVSWSTLVTTTARPPDRVLVTGLGPVGNLAAQIFAAAGYAVTAVDPVANRRALAQSLGLEDVRESVPTDVAALDGDIQLSVECSGHERAVIDCCKIAAKRGEVVLVGVPWRKRCDASAFEVLHAVFHRYVVLRSGWEWEVPVHARDFTIGSIQADLTGALRWLRQGRVKVDGLAVRARPADAQQVWQDLLHQRGAAPTAVFDWSA